MNAQTTKQTIITLTVRRPNGDIEIVPAPAGIRTIHPDLFKTIADSSRWPWNGAQLHESPQPEQARGQQ
jgi:hypothetical protein